MREFYSYVWRSSAPRQIVLRILAISAALLAMAPLELQRHIINTLAGHEHFGPPALPSEVTRAGGRNEVCTTLRWREPDSNHRSRRERDGETMMVGRGVSLDGSRQLFWTEKCCGPTGHTALL